MSLSNHSVTSRCEYWIRVNLALEIHIKEAAVEVALNKQNNPTYVGLPQNHTDLYNYMLQIKQNNQHPLHRVGLRPDQWNKICPPSGQTNINDWDITILIAVIRNVLNIKPKGGWKILTLDPTDKSTGAFTWLILKLRNELKHGTLQEILTPVQFNSFWNQMDTILKGLNYSRLNLFNQLKTEPLDPNVEAMGKILHNLTTEIDDLRDITTDNTKYIRHDEKLIEYLKLYVKHLSASKADKSELNLKADKSEVDKKVDKSEFGEKFAGLESKFEAHSLEKKSLHQHENPIEWNVRQPVHNFHGRMKLLEGIHNQLDKPANKDRKPVILFGMGGIGKTESAAMYVKQYHEKYMNIIWINSSNIKQSLHELLLFVSKTDVPSNCSFEFLCQNLSEYLKNGRTLIILDDMENVEEFRQILKAMYCSIKPFVLVTTQNANLDRQSFCLIQVECFSQHESISFLRKHLTQIFCHVEDLSNLLHSFPLALQQAVKFIKKYELSIDCYIKKFDQCHQSLLDVDLSKYGFTDYQKTLITVWKLSFEKISSNSKALILLGMISYMDYNYINQETFLYSHVIEDEIELNEVIEFLCEFSLVLPTGKTLQVHPLLQKIVRLFVDEELISIKGEKPFELLETLLKQISSKIENPQLDTDEKNLWYPHVCHILKYFPLLSKINMLDHIETIKTRFDFTKFLDVCQQAYVNLEQIYDVSKDVDTFLRLVYCHGLIIVCKSNIIKEEVTSFEEKYQQELKKISHSNIVLWKIYQALCFYKIGDSQTCKLKIKKIYDSMRKIGMSSFPIWIILELAGVLTKIDVEKGKELLRVCMDRRTENLNVDDFFKILKLESGIAVATQDMEYTKDVLIRYERSLSDNNVPQNHCYNIDFVSLSIFNLLTDGKYAEVLRKVDEKVSINQHWWRELRYWKALALTKLKKYKEAESLLSVGNLIPAESEILAYLKFLCHDFTDIEGLLFIKSDQCNNLKFLIQQYKAKLEELNRMKKLEESSITQRNDLVKQCVEFKIQIIRLFGYG